MVQELDGEDCDLGKVNNFNYRGRVRVEFFPFISWLGLRCNANPLTTAALLRFLRRHSICLSQSIPEYPHQAKPSQAKGCQAKLKKKEWPAPHGNLNLSRGVSPSLFSPINRSIDFPTLLEQLNSTLGSQSIIRPTAPALLRFRLTSATRATPGRLTSYPLCNSIHGLSMLTVGWGGFSRYGLG